MCKPNRKNPSHKAVWLGPSRLCLQIPVECLDGLSTGICLGDRRSSKPCRQGHTINRRANMRRPQRDTPPVKFKPRCKNPSHKAVWLRPARSCLQLPVECLAVAVYSVCETGGLQSLARRVTLSTSGRPWKGHIYNTHCVKCEPNCKNSSRNLCGSDLHNCACQRQWVS